MNASLNKKITRGNFVEKKLSELLSPASRDEQQRLSGLTRYPEEIMQCHMVVLGLPRSIFVGNGFGNRFAFKLFLYFFSDVTETLYLQQEKI